MVFKSNVHPPLQNVGENLRMQAPLESVAFTPAH
jgi:hypothetical protein